jgi:hypothetical protein
MQRDRGVAIGLVVIRTADAADGQQAIIGTTKGVVDRQARDFVDQIGEVGHPAIGRLAAIEHAHGQRHIFEPLAALFGGDDDF